MFNNEHEDVRLLAAAAKRLLRPGKSPAGLVLREYQEPLMGDDSPGVVVLHWARQIGKSFTLAAWAVDRLLKNPGRLVTVLSNSRDNGGEFVRKCAEVCRIMRRECEVEGDGESYNVKKLNGYNGERG